MTMEPRQTYSGRQVIVQFAREGAHAGVRVTNRRGEALEDAARRAAIDAVYAARDAGGMMHDAGALAAAAVLEAARQHAAGEVE